MIAFVARFIVLSAENIQITALQQLIRALFVLVAAASRSTSIAVAERTASLTHEVRSDVTPRLQLRRRGLLLILILIYSFFLCSNLGFTSTYVTSPVHETLLRSSNDAHTVHSECS